MYFCMDPAAVSGGIIMECSTIIACIILLLSRIVYKILKLFHNFHIFGADQPPISVKTASSILPQAPAASVLTLIPTSRVWPSV